jgi:hypothetical protein
MSPLPQWLQNLDIVLSLAQAGVWVIGLLSLILSSGWLLGRAAPKRPPPLDPHEHAEEHEIERQEPVTVLGAIRNLLLQGRDLLFRWVMRPEISVEWEVLSVAFQAAGLLGLIWVYLSLDPPAGPDLQVRAQELLQASTLLGIAVFAILLVFGIARLRWRIDYMNRR